MTGNCPTCGSDPNRGGSLYVDQEPDNFRVTRDGKPGNIIRHRTRDKCNTCGYTSNWTIMSENFIPDS